MRPLQAQPLFGLLVGASALLPLGLALVLAGGFGVPFHDRTFLKYLLAGVFCLAAGVAVAFGLRIGCFVAGSAWTFLVVAAVYRLGDSLWSIHAFDAVVPVNVFVLDGFFAAVGLLIASMSWKRWRQLGATAVA